MLYLESSSCSSRGQTFSSCRGLGGEGQRKYYSVTLRTCYHQLQLIQGWIVKGFEVEVNSVLWFLVPQLATTCTPWSWTPPASKSGSRWRTGPGSVTAASLKYCSLDCSKWSTDTYGPPTTLRWAEVFSYILIPSPLFLFSILLVLRAMLLLDVRCCATGVSAYHGHGCHVELGQDVFKCKEFSFGSIGRKYNY